MPDTLKPFEQILEPDYFMSSFVVVNRETGEKRKRTLFDHHSAIASIQLSSRVPDSLQEHFDVARNLFLFSWFAYHFMAVGERHAFSSVEYALRLKSGKPKLMLKEGIELAIKERWIEDSGFQYYSVRREECGEEKQTTKGVDGDDAQAYCNILLDSLPYLRNHVAHGNPMSSLGGLTTLAICADVINQLFDGTLEKK